MVWGEKKKKAVNSKLSWPGHLCQPGRHLCSIHAPTPLAWEHPGGAGEQARLQVRLGGVQAFLSMPSHVARAAVADPRKGLASQQAFTDSLLWCLEVQSQVKVIQAAPSPKACGL